MSEILTTRCVLRYHMTDHKPADEPAAASPNGGDGDAASTTDSEVPWRDVTDSAASETIPSPSGDTTPTQVIAGTTAFIEPTAYCQQCPQFDESAGACTNADTDILETLHDGRFHVADCPVVTADGPAFDRGQRD